MRMKKIKILTLIILGLFFTCNVANAEYTEEFAEHYNAGHEYLAQYRYSSAIDEFRKALRINYMDNSARIGLVNAYLARGTYSANNDKDWSSAANDYRAALFYLQYYPTAQDVQNSFRSIIVATNNLKQCLTMQHFDTSAPSRYKKAEELRLNGQFPEAGYEFAQCAAASYTKAGSYEQIGDMMRNLGNLEKTEDYYKKAISYNPNKAGLRLKHAIALDKLDKDDDAVSEYNYALANGSNDPEILYALERIYRKKLEQMPDSAITLTNLGAVLQKQNRLDEALELYTKSNQIDGSNVTTRMNIGTLYQQKQSYDSAIAAYDSILTLYPDNVQATLYKAQCLAAKGDNENVTAMFNKVMQLDPNNKDAKTQVVESLKNTMKPDEMFEYLKKNSALDADTINEMYDYAIDLHKQNKYDEAIALYKEILRVKLDSAEVYLNMAIAYKQKGEVENAKKTLAEGHAKFPNNKPINDNIKAYAEEAINAQYDEASKAYDLGDYQKALTSYQAVNPPTFDSLAGIATCYQGLKQDAQAIEYYKMALNLKADSDIAYYVSALYAEQENWTASKAYAQKALSINPQNKQAEEVLGSVVSELNAKKLD